MENHTVVQLKPIAKERGIRDYYKLRKAELIHALKATKLVEQQSNSFDEPISNDSKVLVVKPVWSGFTTNIVEVIKYCVEK